MRTIALILVVLGFSINAMAQVEPNVKQSDLQGPAYKNYKVWMDQSESTVLYSENSPKTLEGPAYKNQQAASNTAKENLVAVSIAKDERQQLTGPAYKNYGPWTKSVK